MFEIERLYLNNMAINPDERRPDYLVHFRKYCELLSKYTKNYIIIYSNSNARVSKTRIKDILKIFGE